MKKIKQIDYLKQEVDNSLYEAFAHVKNKISGDLLNFELSILYNNKIYDEETLKIQNYVSNLSDDIDNILNEHQVKCFKSIEKLLSDTNVNDLLNIDVQETDTSEEPV